MPLEAVKTSPQSDGRGGRVGGGTVTIGGKIILGGGMLSTSANVCVSIIGIIM